MKKALLVLTALAVVLSAVTACGKGEEKSYAEYVTDEKGAYVTEADGNIVTTMLDADDVSVEYITDENGKKTLDDEGEYVTILHFFNNVTATDAKGNVVEKVEEIVKTTIGIGDDTIETSVTPETTAPKGETTSTQERIYETKYLPLFASGRFALKMTATVGEGKDSMSMPLVIATDSKSIFFEIKYGIYRIQNIISDGKSIMVLPMIKSYCETEMDVSSEEFGLGLQEITQALGGIESKYVQTSNVKIGGTDYICEEYDYEGAKQRFYFTPDTKEMKRIEMEDTTTGEINIMRIDGFSGIVDDSYFKVPSNYKKVDLDSLVGSLEGVK